MEHAVSEIYRVFNIYFDKIARTPMKRVDRSSQGNGEEQKRGKKDFLRERQQNLEQI